MEKYKRYTFSSDYELAVIGDHQPHKYWRTACSEKMRIWSVTQQEINFQYYYIQGPRNGLADGASRVPVISPGVPAPEGVAEALEQLIPLLAVPKDATTLWMGMKPDKRLRLAVKPLGLQMV